MGALGSANILEVITNYMANANLISCAEALTDAKESKMNLNAAYETMKISSRTSFVHEIESQFILNGSREILFAMDLVVKYMGLFQEVADRAEVPLEINPLLISTFRYQIGKFEPRAFSPNIIRPLQDATAMLIFAAGFLS